MAGVDEANGTFQRGSYPVGMGPTAKIFATSKVPLGFGFLAHKETDM
jgi:hypothetical protein